jgi:predicted Zn-dependent peptidase
MTASRQFVSRSLSGDLHVAGHAVGADRASAAAVADVPRLPFETFTLPNGLHGDPEPGSPAAAGGGESCGTTSVRPNEEPGRTGLRILFEHLMFQGSKHTPPDRIS